jgi:hypothetical protein
MAVNFHCMPSAIGAWSKETPFVPQKLLVFKSFKILLCFFLFVFSFAMLLGCRRVQSKAILYPARFLVLVSRMYHFHSGWLHCHQRWLD